MLDINNKIKRLDAVAKTHSDLKVNPQLYNLFLELTLRCNERCLHCGSRCGDVASNEMTVAQYDKLLHEIREDFGAAPDLMLAITGGEPLIRKDFFDILDIANKLNFRWGMTSNGTLITKEVAKDLKRVGLRSISISIDGLEDTHDKFRRTPGGWKKALEGVQNLIDVGGFDHVQITTVLTHKNIGELDELYKIFNDIDIDSWRIFEMDPIGRALQIPEYLLTPEDAVTMFEFIRNMRMAGEPVTYGCNSYLGLEYEHEVRDWSFFCLAGLATASIACNGDILACLDIERRPELIQGNWLNGDRFKDVWLNKFEAYRGPDLACRSEKCMNCDSKKYCHGGGFHTWDHDKNEQRLCFKGILFD